MKKYEKYEKIHFSRTEYITADCVNQRNAYLIIQVADNTYFHIFSYWERDINLKYKIYQNCKTIFLTYPNAMFLSATDSMCALSNRYFSHGTSLKAFQDYFYSTYFHSNFHFIVI